MYWINSDSLRNSDDPINQNQQPLKPAKRWGQSCVSAHNKLYIIGGYEGSYLGDVWEFDFSTMQYSEMKLEGPEPDVLSRSNHTAIFYEKHNAIYVFGGGQAQKQRFNDTIKIEFNEQSNSKKGQKVMNIERLQLQENSQLPPARTYHASCLMGKYMIIVGGEANSDLRDLWALDLEEKIWYKPEINFLDYFTPKRFHSVTTINDHQVITFGGCHSEYVHMNEMHIFDLSDFIAQPENLETQIRCTKINITQGIPSTRWGHSATNYNGKLYIIGGRNEQDINDIHEFDPEKMKWRELEVIGPQPKPRRRHSALFVSGSIVMFGGFDGNFYDDLNILDFQTCRKQIITIQPSNINMDYQSLVGTQDNSDIVFILDTSSKQKVFGHKALLLFRLIQREFSHENFDEQKLRAIVTSNAASDFIKQVYLAKQGEEIFLKGISCRNSFLKFLEFLYCDRFVDHTTTYQVRKVSEICKELHLPQSHLLLKRKADYAKMKIHQGVLQELQSRQPTQEPIQITKQQSQLIKTKVEQLEQQVKLDFAHIEDMHVQSPEDKQERLHNKALNHMNQCKNLDDFYDILFLVDDTLIKANSLVLSARCPYFKSMLSANYSFKESKVDKSGFIRVQGVPKLYFSCIIQYIYSDHFYIQKSEAEFFIRLMIYADYFMLPRLIDICSSYLKQYVNLKSAVQLLLLAHAHNADQLEKYCINFIAMNEHEILNSRHFRNFKRQAQDALLKVFHEKLEEEKQESFVQICINNYLTKKNFNETSNTSTSHSQSDSQRRGNRQSQSSSNLHTSSSQQSRINLISNNRGFNNSKEEDEIENKIQELLTSTQYIYLEEHQMFESYDHSSIQQPQKSSSALEKVYGSKKYNFTDKDEESKENHHHRGSNSERISQSKNVDKENQMPHRGLQLYGKENQHPNLMSQLNQPRKSKQKLMISEQQQENQTDSQSKSRGFFQMSFGTLSKKKDTKRQPLKNMQDNQIDDEDLLDENPFLNCQMTATQQRPLDSDSNVNQTSQTDNASCNIYQRR